MTNKERHSDSYYDAVITQLQLTTSDQTATIMEYEKRLCDVARLANRVILIGEEEGWFEWKGSAEDGGNHSSLHRDLTMVANQRAYKDFCDAHVRMIKSLEQRIQEQEATLNEYTDTIYSQEKCIVELESPKTCEDMLHLYNELDTIKWWSAIEGDAWDSCIDAVRDCIKKDYL